MDDFDHICAEVLFKHGCKVNVQEYSKLSYTWAITVNDYSFTVIIEDFDENFVTLPTARLAYIPDGLSKASPHLLPSLTLCYLDDEDIELDKFNPHYNIRLVLYHINKTLELITSKDCANDEFEQEFESYWKAGSSCYLIGNNNELTAKCYKRKSAVHDTEVTEWVVYDSKNCYRLNNWLNKRQLTEHVVSARTIKVKFTESPNIASFQGDEWPPENWQEFLGWLNNYHPNIAKSMMQKLCESEHERHKVLIFEKLDGNEYIPWFGLRIGLDNDFISLSKRYKGGRKNNKRTKKVTPLHVTTVLMNQKMGGAFQRIFINDATEVHIYGRNNPKKSFINKKVTLIGAGTVGSNLAHQLVKLGIGYGDSGLLNIVDNDVLISSNISRHVLGEEYLGENKAHALAHFLCKNFSWKLNIKSNPLKLTSRVDVLRLLHESDLVIDASGSFELSTLITECNYVNGSNVICPVVHGWVDANGLAVRAILDDGRFGCYRCLFYNKNDKLNQRFVITKKSKPWPSHAAKKVKCGHSYTPYTEDVSLMCASVISQLSSGYLNGKPSPRFRHISLHDSVPETKDQNVKKLKGCPCCGK